MNQQKETTPKTRDRKTCNACAVSKRKCDKQTPSCQRCVERNVPCQYSSVRPYTRIKKTSLLGLDPKSLEMQSPGSVGASEDTPPSIQPQADSAGDLDNDYQRVLSTVSFTDSMPENVLLDGSWFLGTETWTVQRTPERCPLPPIPPSMLAVWIEEVQVWLRQWVGETRNPFMHRELYLNTGLPRCLQDAWKTLTAYISKTKENEFVTMSVVQASAEELLAEECLSTRSLGLMEHLARVQSLFIYQFIRLFDGNIRQRTLAEKQIPVLTRWCEELWESAILDAGNGSTCIPSSPYDGADPVARIWRQWVLYECVRRSWIVAQFTQGVYLMTRDGQTDCPGGIHFTARQGLWDIASPDAWLRLVQKRGPLFTACNQADQLLVTASPGDVDRFAELQLKMLWGNDKIENWTKASTS